MATARWPSWRAARAHWSRASARMAAKSPLCATASCRCRIRPAARCTRSAPATGAATPVITETAHPWINLSDDTRLLKSGEILWSSERSGFRHLYLYAADGRQHRALTSGDWVVTGVVALDEDGRTVYFHGTR